MNYVGMSKSNYVEVSDKQQLQELVNWVQSENIVPSLQTYWSGTDFALGSSHGPLSIRSEDLDRFFAVLGHCIAEPMVIRNVGYEGQRYTPDAWQWVVFPGGEWYYEGLDDAFTVKENTEDLRERAENPLVEQ